MLSRSTKRMMLAGLLLATRTQFGAAQEVQNAYVVPPGGSRVAPAPPTQPYPPYTTMPAPQAYAEFLPISQQDPAPMPGQPAQPMPTRPMPAQPMPPLRLPKISDDKAPDIGPKAPDASPPPSPIPEPQNFQPATSSALGDTQVAMSAPNIMGDFAGYSIRKTVFVPVTVLSTVTQTQIKVDTPSSGPAITSTSLLSTVVTPGRLLVPVSVQVPVVSRAGSGFKIADDDSPIPTDRVFFSYNYFDGLRGQPGISSGTFPTSVVVGPTTTTFPVVGPAITMTTPITTTSVTGVPQSTAVPQVDLHREVFGFEKTFFGGNASIEVRIPIYQSMNESISNGGFAGDNFGDVTTVFKYALVNQRDRVFSVGLATTFPTGPAIDSDDGSIRAVLFQPFIGFYRGYGDFFVQGFTSLVASTSSQDPTLLFNDYAVGYTLYRSPEGQLLKSVSPVLEIHVTTPLDNHGDDGSGGLIITDIVSFTAGVHFMFGPNSTLSLGCNVPVTGPRPYDIEGIAQLNYRF
jgi:hypothetical protein